MQPGGSKPKLDASRLEIRGTSHHQAQQAQEQLTRSSDGVAPETKVRMRPAARSDAGITGCRVACRVSPVAHRGKAVQS